MSVYNPGHGELRTTCRAAMALPGLALEATEVTVDAGGRVVLR